MNIEQVRKALSAQLPDVVMSLRAKAAEHAPDAPPNERGFRIFAQSADTTVMRVYDEVSWYGVNATDFAAALDMIDTPNIRVEINSPGGDVFDGIAIYQALRNHPSHVTTRVDGIAASIASIIAQAGDTRIVQPASQMMIHNAWGLTAGDSADHADMAALLDQQDNVLAGIYATHAGGTADEFRQLMNAETWMTAGQIVEHGLADQVVEPAAKLPAGNSTDLSLYDEIAQAADAVGAAIDSTTRVAALRAEAGKSLSNRILESLVGLSARIEDINDVLSPNNSDGIPVWSADALEQLLARVDAAHSRKV